MPETKGIRTTFRRKIVLGGVPPQLGGKLAKWAQEFGVAGERVTGSRILNRFAMKCELDFKATAGGHPYIPKDFGILGAGFIGMGTSASVIGVRSIASRRVGEIVASVGESLRWLNEMKVKDGYTLSDGGMITLQVWRISRDRAKELEALTVAGALLRAAAVVKVAGERKPGLLGDGTWRGYRVQLPIGVGYDPRVLFLALTVFKLAVLAPDLLLGGMEYEPRQKILNLLAYFQHLDDDARTVYGGLVRGGYPPNGAGDIRKHWKIPTVETITALHEGWVPGFIHPTVAAVKGMYAGEYAWTLPTITKPKPRNKCRWMPGAMPQNNAWLDLAAACGDLWVDATKIVSGNKMLEAPGMDKETIHKLEGFLGRTSRFAVSGDEIRMDPELWVGIAPEKIRKALLLVPGIAAKPEDVKNMRLAAKEAGWDFAAMLKRAERKPAKKRNIRLFQG